MPSTHGPYESGRQSQGSGGREVAEKAARVGEVVVAHAPVAVVKDSMFTCQQIA
jgi:hypothetical protein